MKLLIGGSSTFMFHLEEFAKKLNEFGVETKLVYDADYATQRGGGQKRLFQLGKLATKPPGRIYWVAFKFWKGPSCFFVQEGIHYLGILPKPKFYSEGGERTKLEPILYFINVILTLPFWIRKPRFVVGQWPLVHIPLVLTLSRLLRKRVVVDVSRRREY